MMTDHSGAPSHIKRLAQACIACELSTGRDKVKVDDGFKMAWAIYRFLHPELLKLCDVAAQHALEEPNYFLSTEVRQQLVGKVFVDDSPQYNPEGRGRRRK